MTYLQYFDRLTQTLFHSLCYGFFLTTVDLKGFFLSFGHFKNALCNVMCSVWCAKIVLEVV